MKEAIILTKQEYNELANRINHLQHENDVLYGLYRNKVDDKVRLQSLVKDLKNQIWEMRNRADIDAFNEASDIEFYDWASEMADKYEAIDDKEWLNEVKGRYCVNCRDFMDNDGKYHIINRKDEA